ncbi:7132_t:CDS:2, partial [Gigaspora rosea]
AQNWIKWRKLPKENRNKFTKISSLLDDERISTKALKQKQSYVRKWHGNGLENWDGNVKNGKKIICRRTRTRGCGAIQATDLFTDNERDIPSEEKRHCVITYNEMTLFANDNEKTEWGLKQLERAINILEIALPDTIFVFGFDNSTNHRAFAEDALIVRRINIGYGEQPKGIKEVMIERKIWNERLRGKCVKCSKDEEEIYCNMKKLSRQLDFMEQKSVLEEI